MFSSTTPPRSPGGMYVTGVLILCSGCSSQTWEEHPLHPLEHFERDLKISEAAAVGIEQGPLAALSARLGGLDVYLPDWVSIG